MELEVKTFAERGGQGLAVECKKRGVTPENLIGIYPSGSSKFAVFYWGPQDQVKPKPIPLKIQQEQARQKAAAEQGALVLDDETQMRKTTKSKG